MRESGSRMALLAYKSIHGLAPAYLSTYCIPVSSLPGRSHLRSAGEWQLLVPRTKTVTLGPRGFFWACPSTWNTLPAPLRDFELSLDSFKRKLKSHFFYILVIVLFFFQYLVSPRALAWFLISLRVSKYTDWLIDWLIDPPTIPHVEIFHIFLITILHVWLNVLY